MLLLLNILDSLVDWSQDLLDTRSDCIRDVSRLKSCLDTVADSTSIVDHLLASEATQSGANTFSNIVDHLTVLLVLDIIDHIASVGGSQDDAVSHSSVFDQVSDGRQSVVSYCSVVLVHAVLSNSCGQGTDPLDHLTWLSSNYRR
jgi:hypothetical protein